MIGPQGVLFTMSSIKEAYLVSSSLVKGTSTMPTDNIRFPDLQKDLTLDLFYGHSKNGSMVSYDAGRSCRTRNPFSWFPCATTS